MGLAVKQPVQAAADADQASTRGYYDIESGDANASGGVLGVDACAPEHGLAVAAGKPRTMVGRQVAPRRRCSRLPHDLLLLNRTSIPLRGESSLRKRRSILDHQAGTGVVVQLPTRLLPRAIFQDVHLDLAE